MKICPKCGNVLSFNSYFGAYICANCTWEDARIGTLRNKGINVCASQSKRIVLLSAKIARRQTHIISKRSTSIPVKEGE